VNVAFNAFDADSTATVSLYYDSDAAGYDGVPFATGLAEQDGPGTFAWDTSSLAGGNYYVYANVEDGNSPPAFAYATGSVVVPDRPRLTEFAFAYETGPQRAVFSFDNLAGSLLTASDVTVVYIATGQPLSASAYNVVIDSTARTMSVTHANGMTWPDGDYRIRIAPNRIRDFAGNTTPDGVTFEYFAMAGDANRDRSVSLTDFTILASNFGTSSIFSGGDFDYSGDVTLGDFTILASQFGKTLNVASVFFGIDRFAVAPLPQMATPADMNSDGKLDLVVGHQWLDGSVQQGKVGVLLNTTPAGTVPMQFASESPLFDVGNALTAIAVADFNGDGKPDVATADAFSDTVSVLINTTAAGSMNISFEPRRSLPSGHYPFGITAADINGDGKPEIIATNSKANESPNAADTISVFINTTVGTAVSFAGKQDIAVGDGPAGVESGDLNGDGKADLAVTNAGSSNVTVLINTTPANGQTPTFNTATFLTGSGPRGLAIVDLNRDGKLDLVTANPAQGAQGNTISALLNATSQGGGTPVFGTKQDFTAGGDPIDVSAGDLDGDGVDDLVVANISGNSVSVFRNTTPVGSSTVTLQNTHTVAVDTAPIFAEIRDLNQDGRADVAVTSFTATGASVSVLLNADIISSLASFSRIPLSGRERGILSGRMLQPQGRSNSTGVRPLTLGHERREGLWAQVQIDPEAA